MELFALFPACLLYGSQRLPRGEFQRFPGEGVGDAQGPGAELLGDLQRRAVLGVAQDGAADVGQMDPELMGAARDGPEPQQGYRFQTGALSQTGDGSLSAVRQRTVPCLR